MCSLVVLFHETYYASTTIRFEYCYKHLIKLPAEIGNLINLEILSLINNNLTSLPAEIGNLFNLQQLNLCYNQLTSLPA
jgi:Leucine-rich repeat (LRR) protein